MNKKNHTHAPYTFHHRVNLAVLGLDRNSKTNSSWTIRRRIIAVTLAFCAGTIWYILLKGIDTETARSIVTNSYYLAIATIGGYIGGATWDDKNKFTALANGAAPPPSPGGSNSSMPAGDTPAGG